MRRVTLALSLLSCCGTAAAEAYQIDEYGYVGIDAGRSVANSPYAGRTANVAGNGMAGTATLGSTDLGYKVFAGYQFNQWYSVEAYYVDLGKINGSATLTAPVVAPIASGSIRASGYGIDGGLDLPFWEEAAFAIKIGAFRSTTTWDIVSATGNYRTGGSSAKTSFKYGLGIKYKVSDQFGVRGMFESYRNLGDPNTIGTGSVSTYTLGSYYKF